MKVKCESGHVMDHVKMDRGWLSGESELALKLSSWGVKELAMLRLK